MIWLAGLSALSAIWSLLTAMLFGREMRNRSRVDAGILLFNAIVFMITALRLAYLAGVG